MATAALHTLDQRAYGRLAIALHWTIALLIFVQMGTGWYMNHFVEDHSPAQDRIEVVHISIGLTTMLLIAVRIGIRLTQPPPPLPAGLAGWERKLSHASHLLFYALMIALPLTGWLLVSLRHAPVAFWGLPWPRLPGASVFATPHFRPLRHVLQDIHTDYLVWLALANIALHVAGALKHQFDGNPVLWRMLPGLKPPTAG